MLFMLTSKVSTDAVCHFLSREQTCWLDDVAFSMNPVRLDPSEPGTFGGQVASHDAHTLALLSRVCMDSLRNLRRVQSHGAHSTG